VVQRATTIELPPIPLAGWDKVLVTRHTAFNLKSDPGSENQTVPDLNRNSGENPE